MLGREDSYSLDGSRGSGLWEVLFGERRVELRNPHVGSDVIRREALLGDVQSGCEYVTATATAR